MQPSEARIYSLLGVLPLVPLSLLILLLLPFHQIIHGSDDAYCPIITVEGVFTYFHRPRLWLEALIHHSYLCRYLVEGVRMATVGKDEGNW
jgi:hypothetical protein